MQFTGSPSRARRERQAKSAPAPAEARIEAGQRKSAAFSTLFSFGCADCCGSLGLSGDGSKILCSRAVEERWEPYGREAVLACSVPKYYQQLMAGMISDVTAEEARAARPRLPGEEG